MDTGMSEKNRQVVSDALTKLLADTYALYLKTQNYHWNVTGPEFYSLHILFEKQYSEMAEAIDEIAERIRSLGFFVEGTFSAFKKDCSIHEEEKLMNARDMVQNLVQGHETVIRHARKLFYVADGEKDQASADLMNRRLVIHEKFAWMLRSQL